MPNEKNVIDTEIDRLTKLIQKELKKPAKKINMEIIREYQNQILMLEKLEPTSQEDMERIITTLEMQAEQRSSQKHSLLKPKSVFKKAILVIAVICILQLTVFTGRAIALGSFEAAWTDIENFVSELLHLAPGEYHTDDITIIKGKDSSRCKSIEEFLAEENMDILYPSALPEGVKLTEITIIEMENGTRLYFNFNVEDFTMSIVPIGKTIDEPDRLQIINTLECYIDQYDGTYEATCYHGNTEYHIEHPYYEELIFIIENLTPLS